MKITITSVSKSRIKDQLRHSNSNNTEISCLQQQAGVLVPLINEQEEWHLLFTKRTDFIATHKGQVSFPGGRVDHGDENLIQTALRETTEEIGVLKQDIEIQGVLEKFYAPNEIWITPVIGTLNWPVPLIISRDEVSKVFTIPLGWFMDQNNIEIKTLQDQSGVERRVIYYREFQGEVVWGISAYIIHEFLRLIVG